MKVCAAQLRPVAGDLVANVAKHLELIELAVSQQADVVFFPELSLTGFEPRLADSLAMGIADLRLDVFQEYSDKTNMLIGVGMPIFIGTGVSIGMVWFTPGDTRRLYAKQRKRTFQRVWTYASTSERRGWSANSTFQRRGVSSST